MVALRNQRCGASQRPRQPIPVDSLLRTTAEAGAQPVCSVGDSYDTRSPRPSSVPIRPRSSSSRTLATSGCGGIRHAGMGRRVQPSLSAGADRQTFRRRSSRPSYYRSTRDADGGLTQTRSSPENRGGSERAARAGFPAAVEGRPFNDQSTVRFDRVGAEASNRAYKGHYIRERRWRANAEGLSYAALVAAAQRERDVLASVVAAGVMVVHFAEAQSLTPPVGVGKGDSI